MRLIRVFGILYFTAVCAAQTQDVPPVPSLQRQSGWLDMYPPEKVELRCEITNTSDWTLIWMKNKGQISDSEPNVSWSADRSVLTITAANPKQSGSYTCKGHHKTKGTTTVESDPLQLSVSYPPTPTLKLLTQWLDVFEDEVVVFSCEVGNPEWIFTWYKNQEELSKEDPTIIWNDERTQLNITSALKSHEGEYACKAQLESRAVSSGFSNTARVTVYDDIPKPTLRMAPGFDPMFVGEMVNFTCSVDVASDWEYQWRKGGNVLPATGEVYSFPLALSHEGKYMCSAFRGKKASTEDSEEMRLNVHEIPVPSIQKVTSWLDVFPGESVQLRCGMNSGSGWTYTWTRDGQKVGADGVVSFDQSGSTLSIKSATSAHAGQYMCKGELKERSISRSSDTGLTLTVYSKKPSVTLTQEPDYKVMFPGESVTFSCHVNASDGWGYLWYKDAKPLSVSDKEFSVNSVSTANTGSYSCGAKRGTDQVFITDQSRVQHLQVQGNKPKPLMTQQPNVGKVYVGESVSFKCKVEGSTGWRYRWYKDGAQQQTNGDTLSFTATLSNKGTYKCSAIRNKTKSTTEQSDARTIIVSEIPVPVTELVTRWLDVFPTENVTLSCGMNSREEVNSDWIYTWYKDQQVQAKGTDGTFTITSASSSDRGNYSCSARLKSRSVKSGSSSGLTLTVYDEKPKVILTQNPAFTEMYTGDNLSFSCHINVSSGWEYLWFVKKSESQISGKNFTIKSMEIKHSGSYQCGVERDGFKSDKSEKKTLNVTERPKASITLLTGWSEVFSAVSLVLKCDVKESNEWSDWNYTWFKENQEIKDVMSEKHTVTPENDPEQSPYTCRGIRNGRPSYSKKSEAFVTKNLLLKRRVLLSISGLIFFGIIAVLLGCIALRVFRKPADDDGGPDEEDLFLSMARQKDAGVPCPLVEFITDATLTSSSKEGEENGTICSETTPLPITSQEEQAGTTEGSDTAETNGGLVSFKQ